MSILKKLNWWLFTPKWYKTWAKYFNAQVEGISEDMKRLYDFCEIMDEAIVDYRAVTIYGNRKFLIDYRLAFGVHATQMAYDGHPIVYRNKKEYFVLDTTQNL